MAVTVTSQKFYDEYTSLGGGGSNWLLSCPCDTITAITEFYVKWSAESVDCTFSSSDNSITRNDGLSFIGDGFRDGDTITVTNASSHNGNYTVSTVTESVLYLTTSPGSGSAANAHIYGTTPVTAADVFFGLIENDEADNFYSKIDTQTQQRYTISGINATRTTAVDMIVATNSKGWVVDAAGYAMKIQGVSNANYKQSFKITHQFIVPAGTWQQLRQFESSNPPAPDYYQDLKALKYIIGIGAKYEATDPDYPHYANYSYRGNSAWYNEHLNGQDATYTVESISFSIGGDAVDRLSYCEDTDVEIIIGSENSTFTTGTTAVVTQVYLPGDLSEVVNTRTKYLQNFAHDLAKQTAGAAAVDGINLGTAYRQIDNVTITYNSPTQITINYTSQLSTALKNRIDAKREDNRYYLIAVNVQSPSVTTTKGTDRVALIADVNTYDCNKDDATLFEVDPEIEFLEPSGTGIGNVCTVFAGGDVIASVPFKVKNSVSALLTNLSVTIQAEHATNGNFTLETWANNYPDACLTNGVQSLDYSTTRGYKLPSGVNSLITVERYPTLDDADYAGYKLTYPFRARYEEWQTLPDANCDFKPATQDWSVISAASGWQIKFVVGASVLATNDYTTEFQHRANIDVLPSTATGTTGISCVINTYNTDGDPITPTSVLIEENTLIEAVFTGLPDMTVLPAGATGIWGCLYLDFPGIGGATAQYMFSSEVDCRAPDNPFISINSTDRANVNITTGSVTVSAFLDHTKLNPSITNYQLRAQMGYTY